LVYVVKPQTRPYILPFGIFSSSENLNLKKMIWSRTLGYPEASAQLLVESQAAAKKPNLQQQQQQQSRRVSMENMDLIKMTPGKFMRLAL
jgi:hypothetical protein